jgi:hypothetical protein
MPKRNRSPDPRKQRQMFRFIRARSSFKLSFRCPGFARNAPDLPKRLQLQGPKYFWLRRSRRSGRRPAASRKAACRGWS